VKKESKEEEGRMSTRHTIKSTVLCLHVRCYRPDIDFSVVWHVVLCVFLACGLLFLSGCNKNSKDALEVLKAAEPEQYEGKGLQKEKIEELKADIAKYEAEVEKTLKDTQKLGNFYKLLAYAYLNDHAYGPAMDAFKRAIYFYPDNYILHTMAGITTAKLAKAAVEEGERARLFSEAEKYYLNALNLNENYADALYGLSILYVFELSRPLEAEPYLLRLLEKEKNNTDAMFLLARVYVIDGRTEDAVALYDRIIRTTKNEAVKKQAMDNKQTLLSSGGESYGSQ